MSSTLAEPLSSLNWFDREFQKLSPPARGMIAFLITRNVSTIELDQCKILLNIPSSELFPVLMEIEDFKRTIREAEEEWKTLSKGAIQ